MTGDSFSSSEATTEHTVTTCGTVLVCACSGFLFSGIGDRAGSLFMCAATMLTTSCDAALPVDDKMDSASVVPVDVRGRTTLVILTIRASISLFRFNISSLSRSCSRMKSSIRLSSASISFTIPGLCAETDSGDAVGKPDVVAGGFAV